MNKKDYLNLISTYIRVILGFIGISSSLLIPILITFYFRYFNITAEVDPLTPEQTNYINQNLSFLIFSIFIFVFSLLISLSIFAKLTFSEKRINHKRVDFFVRGVMVSIVIGIACLLISLLFLLLFFIPNKLFIPYSAFFSIFILILVFSLIYILSKL